MNTQNTGAIHKRALVVAAVAAVLSQLLAGPAVAGHARRAAPEDYQAIYSPPRSIERAAPVRPLTCADMIGPGSEQGCSPSSGGPAGGFSDRN